MTNKQESLLKMFREVIRIFLKYAQAVKSIAALDREAKNLESVTAEIDEIHPRQAVDGKGVTQSKNQLRESLELEAAIMAGALFSYGTHKGDADLCQRMNFTERTLERMTVADFIKFINMVKIELDKAGTAIAEYGPSTDEITQYGAKVEKFKKESTAPRNVVVEKSTATTELEDAFTRGNNILKNHTDNLMLKFKLSNTAFFNDYTSARIIEDRGSRSTSKTKAADKNVD